MYSDINYLFGLIFLLLISACGSKKPEGQNANQPVPVNVQKVVAKHMTFFEQVPGTIVSLNQVDIRAEVTGYVTGILFKEGSYVKKGQLLYEIDKRKYKYAYEQAFANVKIAESNLVKAQKDYDRYMFLLKKDAVAKQRVDYAVTDLENAKQQLTYANESLSTAKTNLSFASIRSPLNGVIGINQVKLGALVSEGQTILNTISKVDSIALDFPINQKLIPMFVEINKRKTEARDSLFTIVLPNDSIYKYPGEIVFFDRALDPTTGALRVRLRFYNPDNLLKVGMNCNIRIKHGSNGKVLVVPFKAVTEQMGEYFVYVAEHNKANQKKITPGTQVENEMIVMSGVKEGDTIVTDGIQKLKQGAPINTSGKAAPPENKK